MLKIVKAPYVLTPLCLDCIPVRRVSKAVVEDREAGLHCAAFRHRGKGEPVWSDVTDWIAAKRGEFRPNELLHLGVIAHGVGAARPGIHSGRDDLDVVVGDGRPWTCL